MKNLFAAVMIFGASLSVASFADSGHGYGPGYGPGYGHGYGPGYGHGHGHGGYHRPITCVARNLMGMTFSATGRYRFAVEQHALDHCYSAGSRVCRVVACY